MKLLTNLTLILFGAYANVTISCENISDAELSAIERSYIALESKGITSQEESILLNMLSKIACRPTARELRKNILKDVWKIAAKPDIGYTFAMLNDDLNEKYRILKEVVSKNEHPNSLYALGELYEKKENLEIALTYYKRAMFSGSSTAVNRIFHKDYFYDRLDKNESFFVVLETFRKTYPNSYARKEISEEFDKRLKELVDPQSEKLIRFYLDKVKKD